MESQNKSKIASSERITRSKTIDKSKKGIKQLMRETNNWSLHHLATIFDINQSLVKQILTEMRYKKSMCKWIPDNLSDEQKDARVQVAQQNLSLFTLYPGLLASVMAIDEIWLPLYMCLPRRRPYDYLFPEDEKSQQTHSGLHKKKSLLVIGMDINGIQWYHLLTEGQVMTPTIYTEIIKYHVNAWAEWTGYRPIILHDSARSHQAKIVQDFIAKEGWEQLPHPQHSPDMNPCNYQGFKCIKDSFKGRLGEFDTLEFTLSTIISNMNIKDANGQFTLNGVSKLPEVWKQVITSEGNYL